MTGKIYQSCRIAIDDLAHLKNWTICTLPDALSPGELFGGVELNSTNMQVVDAIVFVIH
jgi:hypothetical protein